MSAHQWREARRAWKRLGAWLDADVTGLGSRDREPDPLDALGDVTHVRRLLDEVELRAVRCARQRGRSWAEIATRLGMTRQSAWERWRDLDDAVESAPDPLAELEFGRVRRRGWVVVPNVVGLPFEDARSQLTSMGLEAVGSDPDGPPIAALAGQHGHVSDQSPEAGAHVPAGSQVILWIDRGEGGVREPRRPRPDPLPARKYLPDPADEAVG